MPAGPPPKILEPGSLPGTGPPGRPLFYRETTCVSIFRPSCLKEFCRCVIAKVELHTGEPFPRIGFIVPNIQRKPGNVVRFYNRRGVAEGWIVEGKYALGWTRLLMTV